MNRSGRRFGIVAAAAAMVLVVTSGTALAAYQIGMIAFIGSQGLSEYLPTCRLIAAI